MMTFNFTVSEEALERLAAMVADAMVAKQRAADAAPVAVSIAEAARRLSVSPRTARNYVNAGLLKRVPGSRTRVFLPEAGACPVPVRATKTRKEAV